VYGGVRRGCKARAALDDGRLPADWPRRPDERPRGNLATATAFEDMLAPDAFGVQLLGASYTGRLELDADAAGRWHAERVGDATLLAHTEPARWFAAPPTQPADHGVIVVPDASSDPSARALAFTDAAGRMSRHPPRDCLRLKPLAAADPHRRERVASSSTQLIDRARPDRQEDGEAGASGKDEVPPGSGIDTASADQSSRLTNQHDTRPLGRDSRSVRFDELPGETVVQILATSVQPGDLDGDVVP
jgi:hypothetical protein